MSKLIDTFANRLNIAIKLNNIKPIALARQTGISKTNISFYMSGKYEAKQDGIKLLSDALHINPVWLMGYDVPIGNMLFERNIDINRFNEITREAKGLRVPVLGTIPAGIPIEAIEDILDYEEIPQSWLNGNRDYFALKIEGNSMLPKYETRRRCYI